MLRTLKLAVAAAAVAATSLGAQSGGKLNVVTTTTDLHDIAEAVGGNRISAIHISEGYQDPHFVEAKPSFILRLRNAHAFAYVGLDLEVGWMSLLVDGSRNSRIRPGAPGNIDVSRAIPVLDQVRGNVDRSQGDVHPLGNPHYWLDAGNGRRIARLFRDRFTALDPAGASVYAQNTRDFEARLAAAERTFAPLVAKIRGKPVVAWHTSWKYLAQYTGMNIVGFIEPKPGVPPSPAHLAGLVATMKRTGAKVIIMEPFYNRKTADFVAARTGAKVLILPPSVGGIRSVRDYIGLLRYDIEQLANAL
jgi:zinc/manganese transport system substrate-binding protein